MILANLLPYVPGHSGFSNYVQRVMENFGLYFHRLKPVSPYKLKKYSIFHFLKGKF
jgi:hypothetical protein